MIFKALLLFCALFYSQSGFCERVDDINQMFPVGVKHSFETRLEKLASEQNLGIYIFPYALVKKESSHEEMVQTLLNAILNLTEDSSTLKTYNYVYYGRLKDDNNWNLWLTPLTLTIDGIENGADLKEKFDAIYSEARKSFVENPTPSVKKSLEANISFIERQFSPSQFNFSFDLTGFPATLLFALSGIVWFWAPRFLYILLLGIVQGLLISLVTTRHLDINTILTHLFASILIAFLFFVIQSIRVNIRFKRDLKKAKSESV